MKQAYTSDYIKIYFWQFFSVILGLASLFVVIPFLSSNKLIYGIYSICTSLTIFYSYADIGFLSAGQKYASEYFAKGDLKNEIKIISFTSFILFVFISIVSLIILYVSFNPQLIISGISSVDELFVAKQLLIILALSSPIIVCQRTLQVVFSVRIKDYIYQRISVLGNAIKILSVIYFFSSKHYEIVSYFLFIQIVNLLIVLYGIYYINKKYNYSLSFFLKEFRFSKSVYKHVKSLAFTSLVLTLSWIVYYELDQFVIGKFIGANSVAIFAIALSLLSLFRSFFGIFYSPFTARFNHFVGAGDFEGLKKFYTHVVRILLPVVVIPILVVAILSRPFILSWVGSQYYESIEIASLLVLCNIFGFISYPAGALFVALERIRILYINALLIPIVYWLGIFLSYSYLGLKAFAVFKIIAFIISAIVYLYYSLKFTEDSFDKFIKEVIVPYMLPIFISIIAAFYLKDFMTAEHSKFALLTNILVIGFLVSSSIAICLITSKYFREYIYSLIRPILKKNK